MIRSVLVSCLLAAPLLADPLSQDALAAMARADIVILGEIHDNPAHHEGQARIIDILDPTAVVFEMLSAGQAATVNAVSRSDPELIAEAIDWAGSGWPDFSLYAPIFVALGQVPVVGAALPREDVRGAFDTGAAAVFGDEADRFGLMRTLPELELETRTQLQFDAHCGAMPRAMMGGMVEAQRLRDAHFARVALAALDTYGAPVVMIAGNGHARRDWGMPASIAGAAPTVGVYAVGFVEAPARSDDPRFDLTVATPAAARPDPCETFNKK